MASGPFQSETETNQAALEKVVEREKGTVVFSQSDVATVSFQKVGHG